MKERGRDCIPQDGDVEMRSIEVGSGWGQAADLGRVVERTCPAWENITQWCSATLTGPVLSLSRCVCFPKHLITNTPSYQRAASNIYAHKYPKLWIFEVSSQVVSNYNCLTFDCRKPRGAETLLNDKSFSPGQSVHSRPGDSWAMQVLVVALEWNIIVALTEGGGLGGG